MSKKNLQELFIEDLGQVTGGAPGGNGKGKGGGNGGGNGGGGVTTLALGEEDPYTTLALGEEDGGDPL